MIKRILKILIVLGLLAGGGWAVYYNFMKNEAEIQTFETTQLTKVDIKKTAVATGKIEPKEEVEIKPNISGVIEKIFIKEGDVVKANDLIATIKVIPDVGSLNNAQQQIRQAKIILENEQKNYKRQKQLYDEGVIAKAEYESALNTYQLAKQDMQSAQANYKVAQTGVAPGLEKYATTQIRSTINGMILNVPVEIGNTVQELSNYSVGTTIATMADVSQMIFKGEVDEAEVGNLDNGMTMNITVGALPGEEFIGTLYYISPLGVEEDGVVQFEIEANVELKDSIFIRAGYSANGEIIIENKAQVLSLEEANIQYDDNGQSFVEVKVGEGWENKNVTLGASNGEYVQIVNGLTESDEIKVWNVDLEEEEEPRGRH